MLKDHLKTKHLLLDTGKTTLSLEKYYWAILDYLADEDGQRDWRDWFYLNVLPDYKGDVPLAAHTRLTITTALLQDLEAMKDRYDPVRREWREISSVA